MSSDSSDDSHEAASGDVSDQDFESRTAERTRFNKFLINLTEKTHNEEIVAEHNRHCVQRRPSWSDVHNPKDHGTEVAHNQVYRQHDVRRTRSVHDLPRRYFGKVPTKVADADDTVHALTVENAVQHVWARVRVPRVISTPSSTDDDSSGDNSRSRPRKKLKSAASDKAAAENTATSEKSELENPKPSTSRAVKEDSSSNVREFNRLNPEPRDMLRHEQFQQFLRSSSYFAKMSPDHEAYLTSDESSVNYAEPVSNAASDSSTRIRFRKSHKAVLSTQIADLLTSSEDELSAVDFEELVTARKRAFASWRDQLPENRFEAVKVWKVPDDDVYLNLLPERRRRDEWRECLKRRADYLVMKRRSVWHHIGQGQLLPEHDLEVDLEGNLPTQIPHANSEPCEVMNQEEEIRARKNAELDAQIPESQSNEDDAGDDVGPIEEEDLAQIHNELYGNEDGWPESDVDDFDFSDAEPTLTGEWHHGRRDMDNAKHDPQQAFVLFSQISAKHFAGRTLQKDLWNGFYRVVANDAKRYETNRKRMEKDYPTVSMDITLREKSSGQLRVFTAKHFPRTRFRRNEFQVMSIYYHCDVSDIARFHAEIHNEGKKRSIKYELDRKNYHFNLGIDGVPHSKSGAKKMTLLSVQFEDCRLIYNTGVFIRANNYSVSAATLLQRFVNEAKTITFPLKLRYVVMDLVMKCFVLNIKQFNGSYGCTNCITAGESRHSRGGFVYPSSCKNDYLRTREMFEQFGSLVANAELDPPEVVYGFKGISKLLEVPTFRPELQVPVEPMHLVSGITTKLFELFFARGPGDAASWKTVFTNRVNNQIQSIQLPRECQRTFEELDLPRNKSQELRNFLLFGFDAVAKILHHYELVADAEVWAQTAYFLRCLLLPSPWFEDVDRQIQLRAKGEDIYENYEKTFGSDNCTINVHHLFAHAYDWRRRSQLHEVSAEPFESSYGEAKRRFRPGTDSEGTQIMIGTFVAAESGHFCQHGVRVAPKLATNKRNDSIFFDEFMTAYKCVEATKDIVTCQVIVTGKYQPNYINDQYNMTFAGVFAVQKWPLENDRKYEFETDRVVAKGVKLAENVICVATIDMLRM